MPARAPKARGQMRPTRPAATVRIAYQRQLEVLIDEMHSSTLYWLRATYRAREGEITQDASPAGDLAAQLRRRAAQWRKMFADKAPDFARRFIAKVDRHATNATKQAAVAMTGMSVSMKDTLVTNTVLQALTQENVSLIKSIQSEYATEVEGLVMRSITSGRDLSYLTDQLQERFSVTRSRAKLIANDQNNKATAQMARARQMSLGINKARWLHVGGGKKPRHSHVEANGKIFDLSKGLKIDGEYIFPGELINCLPYESQIEFAAGCKRLWRRRYRGETVVLVTESGKTLEATSNHPILTAAGWKAVQRVDLFDDVICIGDQVSGSISANVESPNSSIGKAFDAIALYVRPHQANVTDLDFHGDASHEQVDVVDIDGLLPNEFDAAICKDLAEFIFARANEIFAGFGLQGDSALETAAARLFASTQNIVCGLGLLLPLFRRHESHDECRRFAAATRLNVLLKQNAPDHVASHAKMLCDLLFANGVSVHSDDNICGKLLAIAGRASLAFNHKAPSADVFGQIIGCDFEMTRGLGQSPSGFHQFDRVVNKFVRKFSGYHVYNLETSFNWYSSQKIVVHNCGCVAAPIIPGVDNDEDE
jgi:hypothetical protein